jgi:flagellar motor component MotA
MSYVSIIAVFTLIVMGILTGGVVSAFIDTPSALIVFLPTLFLTLMTHGVGDVFRAIVQGLGSSDISDDDKARGKAIFKVMAIYTLGTGIIGTTIGLISVLQNLDDPSSLGQWVATAMIPLFYANVSIVCILLPLRSSIANR